MVCCWPLVFYSARRFQKVCSQVCCTPPLFCTPRTPRRVSFRVPGYPELIRFRVFELNPRRFEGARGVFKSTRGVCFEAPHFSRMCVSKCVSDFLVSCFLCDSGFTKKGRIRTNSDKGTHRHNWKHTGRIKNTVLGAKISRFRTNF